MSIPALAQPLELPCGLTVPNRLAKAATSEKLATRSGAPDAGLATLYRRWADGGVGLSLTGNVIIDAGGREGRGNVVIDDDRHLAALTAWAEAGRHAGTRLIMQISHAGRQAPKSITRRPVAPSAVALEGVGGLTAEPRALDDGEIELLIERFARTALVAERAGFDGVQLHGAHGYLISQFLSPRSNRRTDRWGGTLDNRLRFLRRCIAAIRGVVQPGFAVAVKLNSADFQRGGFTEDESMLVAQELAGEAVDFIEISGGNYESTVMFNDRDRPQRESTRLREAYFLEYVEKVRARVAVPLMLTGGFRSAASMEAALANGAVDLVGMARPLIVEPDLPARLLAGTAERAVQIDLSTRSRLLSNLFLASWYGRQIRRMAAGKAPDQHLNRWWSLAVEGVPTYAFNPLAALLPRPSGKVTALPTLATES